MDFEIHQVDFWNKVACMYMPNNNFKLTGKRWYVQDTHFKLGLRFVSYMSGVLTFKIIDKNKWLLAKIKYGF